MSNVTNAQTQTPQMLLAQFAAEEGAGSHMLSMKLAQDGTITAGGDRKVPPTERFVAVIPEVRRGAIRLEKGMKRVAHIGKVTDGFVAPSRASLGDPDMIGSKEDPWKTIFQLPLIGVNDGRTYVFETLSQSGRGRVADLVADYNFEAPRHPGQLPIITIKVKSETSKKFGLFNVPDFTVVGWSDFGMPPKAIAEPQAPQADPVTDNFDLDARWERED